MEDYLYKEMILELNRNPLNKKVVQYVTHEKTGNNPTCGDTVTIQLTLSADGCIADIGWQGSGCAISTATVSLLTDSIKGKTLDDVEKFTQDDMIALLGIPISHTRDKCALLAWQTLQNVVINPKV